MTVILNSAFATAEDTAKELGVSKARLKRLLRIVSVHATASGHTSGRKFSYKNTNGIRVSASARKNARGKAKKVAR